MKKQNNLLNILDKIDLWKHCFGNIYDYDSLEKVVSNFDIVGIKRKLSVEESLKLKWIKKDNYYESLKKITNLRDKKQVTVKLLQEILHKAGLNYGKRKRNDLIKLVAPLWQGVHKITNDKRYKL